MEDQKRFNSIMKEMFLKDDGMFMFYFSSLIGVSFSLEDCIKKQGQLLKLEEFFQISKIQSDQDINVWIERVGEALEIVKYDIEHFEKMESEKKVD